MLKGRESLARLVGKRRRFLPNRQSILSAPTTQSSLNLGIDENGKIVSMDDAEGSSFEEEEKTSVEMGFERVACPVCGVEVSGQSNVINSHLDMCLSRGTKRKLTQRTLLELNFCSKSKVKTSSYDSEELARNLFHTVHDQNLQYVSQGLSELTAIEESPNSPSQNRINNEEISEVPDLDVIITNDDIYEVVLETFIVGRKFGDETELNLGERIHLSRDPDNVKDPNAIKVTSSDSGCHKVLGFLPRKLAQYLSPLIDKYFLNFEGCVTFVPKHSIDVVPIQIVCHKTSDAKEYYDDAAFKWLWKNAQLVIESTKSCPPSAIKYQDNFRVFLHEVLRSNSHLWTDDENNFMESFTSLSDDSQRPFVRLYTRKGPWFRLSAISYPEILDPQQAAKQLSAIGYAACFEVSNELCDDDVQKILDLLTVSELREILCTLKQPE